MPLDVFGVDDDVVKPVSSERLFLLDDLAPPPHKPQSRREEPKSAPVEPPQLPVGVAKRGLVLVFLANFQLGETDARSTDVNHVAPFMLPKILAISPSPPLLDSTNALSPR